MEENTTAIAEYSATTAELAKLKAGLTGKIYAVDNATGMSLAKFDRRGLVTLRTDLDKLRLKLNAEDQGRIKLRNEKAKEITAELLELENPIDEQIKAEESKKEAEKAEKLRLAAIAQQVLEDKILAVSKLPLKCMNESAYDIGVFLARLEAKEVGAEFTGATRLRAEAAKLEAITEIRVIHAAAIEKENATEVAKAEAEVAAAFEEQKRLEMAAKQRELDEQKRLNDIENERLRAEREAFEAVQAEARAKEQEAARIETERQAAIQAEEKRLKEQAEAGQKEADHQAAIVAEQKRAAAEKERKAAEKARKLAESKFADANTALQAIQDICADDRISDYEARAKIALIAEGNL